MAYNVHYDHVFDDLRRKLHDRRGSKAAVMVGAGFSLNAQPKKRASSGFPLWNELSACLVRRLYPNPDQAQRVLREAGAISSSLRLAQEFEVAFGRTALIELVREVIFDDDYDPAPVHEALVDLPWADIFTTNYDRLIERATRSRTGNTLRKRTYDLVTQSVDLPLARRPRIVKLHGTLPDLSQLILTEEDFRCYPAKYASFVNAVRASLSENAFCLAGFSGDDPNFLAWTGWIRDTLGEATPHIYMFCDRLPSPFKCQLLERRKVVPIPIGQLSGGKKYADAFLWLFNRLAEDPAVATVSWNRPPDIVTHEGRNAGAFKEPWNSGAAGPEGWIETALVWRHNRKKYGGWAVLHRAGIDCLWSSTQFWLRDLNARTSEQWAVHNKVLVLRELTWRLATSLQPLPDRLVTDVIDPAIEAFELANLDTDGVVSIGACNDTTVPIRELQSDVLAIRLELVRHARETGDSERFERLSKAVRQDERCTETDRCFLMYQKLLFLLGQLRNEEVRGLLRSWDTRRSPGIWTVRKSGLLLELGEVDDASGLLIDFANDLTLRRSDPSIDFGQRSTEGLTLYLLWLCQQHYEVNRNRRTEESKTHDEKGANSSAEVVSEKKRESDVAKDDDSTSCQSEQSQHDRELLDESEIRQRLVELRPLGCDPQELVTWLTVATEQTPDFWNRPRETDSFDVGRTQTSFPSHNIDEFTNTYRALRFIEEAGLPLSVHGRIPIAVMQKTFVKAAERVSAAALNEGIGLILRARDAKLVEHSLTRGCLASLNDSQLQTLYGAAWNAFNESLERVKSRPERREHEDEWWERRFEFATVLLARLVPQNVRLPRASRGHPASANAHGLPVGLIRSPLPRRAA